MTHVNLLDPRFASPLDVLVKNFFHKDAIFDKPSRQAVTHPIDVYEDEHGLKVSYKKGEDQQSTDDKHYYHTGVRKSSFDFGWKVARRFNLSKANAEMQNGLLCIQIPYAAEAKPKTLTIK